MKKNKNAIILKKNIKIFKILASAFANEEITILQSHDDTGSYYEKNIILPKKISLVQKKQLNKYCYIYKILFSIISKKLNLYIRNNKENIDYKILCIFINNTTLF